jgi:hypothetical protein
MIQVNEAAFRGEAYWPSNPKGDPGMLETLTALPTAHQAYLAMVVIGFSAFALTLGTVSTWVNLSK